MKMSWRYEEYVEVRSPRNAVRSVTVHMVFKWRKGRMQLVHLCMPHCSNLSPRLLHQVYRHVEGTCACSSAADDIRDRSYSTAEDRGKYSEHALRWFNETHDLWTKRVNARLEKMNVRDLSALRTP